MQFIVNVHIVSDMLTISWYIIKSEYDYSGQKYWNLKTVAYSCVC